MDHQGCSAKKNVGRATTKNYYALTFSASLNVNGTAAMVKTLFFANLFPNPNYFLQPPLAAAPVVV